MAQDSGGHQSMRVASTRRVAEEIVHARLERPDGGTLPEWSPGAHVEVRMPSGLVRHYSLCGDPIDRTGYEIAVLREPAGRGGSAEFHRDIRPGSHLGVGAPRNNFPLEPSEDYLFIAGGVGITPILPMVRQAMKDGARWRLVYGGRARGSMAFVDLAESLDPGRVAIHAEDETGRPDLLAELRGAGAHTRIYSCGPAPMLDALVALHTQHEIPAPLHLERFVGEAAGDISGSSFEVVARRSGFSTLVGSDQTILAALREKISGLPFSCEEGYCGTCETDVVEGIPDHRDTYLDEDEKEAGETMMICVSRCRGSRIVLDL